LRNERDSHSRADHSQQTGKLAAFKNHLGVNTRAITSGDGIFAKAVAIAEQEERLFANVFQRNRAPPCKFVLLREHGKEGLGEKRHGFEFVTANGKGEDRNVHSAGAEAIQKDRRDFLDDGELHLGKFPGEGGKHARKQIRCDRRNGANDNGPGYGIFLRDHVAARGFELAQDGARSREKSFSEFGEAHGTGEAIEEARAEFVLEFEDLLGH